MDSDYFSDYADTLLGSAIIPVSDPEIISVVPFSEYKDSIGTGDTYDTSNNFNFIEGHELKDNDMVARVYYDTGYSHIVFVCDLQDPKFIDSIF